LKSVDLLLVCLEDWQGAYIDGSLVAEGHEVNIIEIVKKYKYFLNADWKYLEFETDEDFIRFFSIRGGSMPLSIADMEEWL
jgi:hypothetical protein